MPNKQLYMIHHKKLNEHLFAYAEFRNVYKVIDKYNWSAGGYDIREIKKSPSGRPLAICIMGDVFIRVEVPK